MLLSALSCFKGTEGCGIRRVAGLFWVGCRLQSGALFLWILVTASGIFGSTWARADLIGGGGV
jgi:hypothetical protein